jgi:ADP-ribose pyrophosphatase YjhB (NUDIX family)
MDHRGEEWQHQNSWGLPKGRMARVDNETALRCALREMQEETGLDVHAVRVIHSLGTVSDEYTGTDGKKYCSTYYIARLINDVSKKEKVDQKEVRQVTWATLEECKTLNLRPSLCELIDQSLTEMTRRGSQSPPTKRRTKTRLSNA